MTVTVADIDAARRTIAGQVLRTPMLPAPRLSALTGAAGVRQIREPPGHQLVQGARRTQQARLAHGQGTQRRRHRDVGRQSRPGGGLSRRAAQDPRHHRDAGDDADREGRGNAGARRHRRARRRNGGRGADESRGAGARTRPDLGASLRRRPRDRRAGDDRSGDAGGRAGPRHAGDPDRRRRADRRQCDGGARAETIDRGRRRRGGDVSLVLECAHRRSSARAAARRWPKASR